MTTNDDHLAELVKLAEMYEKSAKYFNDPSMTRIGTLHQKRADAIRWILSETAYAVEEHTPV